MPEECGEKQGWANDLVPSAKPVSLQQQACTNKGVGNFQIVGFEKQNMQYYLRYRFARLSS